MNDDNFISSMNDALKNEKKHIGIWRIGLVSAAFVIVVLFICMAFIGKVSDANRKAMLTELEDYAATVQMTLRTRIQSDFGILESVSVCLSAVDETDSATMAQLLRQINYSNDFTRMGLASKDGQVTMYDLDGSVYATDFSNEPFFKSALGGKTAIQNTVKDPHSEG